MEQEADDWMVCLFSLRDEEAQRDRWAVREVSLVSAEDKRAWRQAHPDRSQAYDRRRRSYFFNLYARRVLKRKGLEHNYMEDVSVELVWAQQDGRCARCRFPMLDTGRAGLSVHYDHRYPLCWGGLHKQSNIQALHQVCHVEKSRIKKEGIVDA